jgi:DNA-binding response OmpR family regulator
VQKKGLVVIHEDDDLIRQLLERWLVEAGYAVRATAEEAPSLVIVNVPSPNDAQPMIQSLKAAYAAPILVLSARFRRGLAGSEEAAHRLEVRKVLPKPFTREELLSAVEASMDGEA